MKRRSRAKVSPARKVLGIVKNVLVWLVVIAAVSMMIFTVISVTTFDRSDRDLFGYKAFIVRTDSMSATDFEAGDLILIKEVDPSTLKEGDIIAYRSTAIENYGEVITHKIRALTTASDGSAAFITYGTTTDIDDSIPVAHQYVLGKYAGKLPGIGAFFTFLKTTPGYILCILLPFTLLIVAQGVNTIRLYQKYKKQQQKELERERGKIEAERQELSRMADELMQMRAQMGLDAQALPKDVAQNEPPGERQPHCVGNVSNDSGINRCDANAEDEVSPEQVVRRRKHKY